VISENFASRSQKNLTSGGGVKKSDERGAHFSLLGGPTQSLRPSHVKDRRGLDPLGSDESPRLIEMLGHLDMSSHLKKVVGTILKSFVVKSICKGQEF
jgi:hypothetical protein